MDRPNHPISRYDTDARCGGDKLGTSPCLVAAGTIEMPDSLGTSWCVVDVKAERVFPAIREPSMVLVAGLPELNAVQHWFLPFHGAHGIDINHGADLLYVACDRGLLVEVDARSGAHPARDREVSSLPGSTLLDSQIRHLFCYWPDQRCRHSEVLAVFGEPRRVEANASGDPSRRRASARPLPRQRRSRCAWMTVECVARKRLVFLAWARGQRCVHTVGPDPAIHPLGKILAKKDGCAGQARA
jgi:hypothetical protein